MVISLTQADRGTLIKTLKPPETGMTETDTTATSPPAEKTDAAPRYSYRRLEPGDAAPRFRQASPANDRFVFDSVAGRYLVLCFISSASDPAAIRAISTVRERPDLFNDSFASFFAVTADPADRGSLRNQVPGFRVFYDDNLLVARLYGAAPLAADDGLRPRWVICDPALRVIDVIPFAADGSDARRAIARIAALPPVEMAAGRPIQAPILYIPRVFEPELCARLVALYEAEGGQESGFMRVVDGKTVPMHDLRHKSRADVYVTDPQLQLVLQDRIRRRVLPDIQRAHAFEATRMERYVIGCYDAESGGHFKPHRDNTTPATAHRRFAISINLNSDFDGGEVSFPEFSSRGFKAAPGYAVVFSCSLLHAVSPVRRGRRYAFLPFVYDDAAAASRTPP